MRQIKARKLGARGGGGEADGRGRGAHARAPHTCKRHKQKRAEEAEREKVLRSLFNSTDSTEYIVRASRCLCLLSACFRPKIYFSCLSAYCHRKYRCERQGFKSKHIERLIFQHKCRFTLVSPRRWSAADKYKLS